MQHFWLIRRPQAKKQQILMAKTFEKEINNSLHLAWEYARIFVCAHYLFREVKNCEQKPQGKDDIQGQISERILMPNGGYCVNYPSNTRSFRNWRTSLGYSPVLAGEYSVIAQALGYVEVYDISEVFNLLVSLWIYRVFKMQIICTIFMISFLKVHVRRKLANRDNNYYTRNRLAHKIERE